MRLDISEYFSKEFKSVYNVFHRRMGRYMACLVRPDNSRKTISYAKYVYQSYHKCEIVEGCDVDHINRNKLDDRVENLRVVSRKENTKDNTSANCIIYRCDYCGSDMLIPERLLTYKKTITCSRSCGGKQSHITKKKNLEAALKHSEVVQI